MFCDNKSHANTFVALNGIPYLVAEYLDRRCIQQLQRSWVQSNIFVDQSESMRAVVDISIDDIGTKSNGHLSILGNQAKQKQLLNMIARTSDQFEHQLNVLRRGIIVRVNYEVKNYRTHQTLRSMVEDIPIGDRNYFMDINSDNINDNAFVINFCDTRMSTINEFTHGCDKMEFCITNVQLFYEAVQYGPKVPRIKNSMVSNGNQYAVECYDTTQLYKYHDQMQSQHVIGTKGCNCGSISDDLTSKPSWSMFNRFYHFDSKGSEMILHENEVYDPFTKVIKIPCGNIRVNRTFIINPGHRIIFKISIWKNDLIAIDNTTCIAKALKAPIDYNQTDCNHHHHHDDPDKKLKDTISRLTAENKRQSHEIRELKGLIRDLQNEIDRLHPSEEYPDDGCDCGCDDNCDCNNETMTIDEVKDMIDACR